MKTTTLAWTPFTGLGLYGGFRGNRWLRNRIKIFEQFVIPSLLNQTDQDFIHWVAWRPEERDNPHVINLLSRMKRIPGYRVIFTFGGLCMWDDKFSDDEASNKLVKALYATLPELEPVVTEDIVNVLLVPSDDLYCESAIEWGKRMIDENPGVQAVGYKKGYICNYHTKEVLEYNPNTNPPFFMARFPRAVFLDPQKHYNYISTKTDEGKYKAGTPYPSHEWIPNAFEMASFDHRGFMVGTHGENISTHFNHPFGGRRIVGLERNIVLDYFGILDADKLKLPLSIRKKIMRRLPYRWQRKLRYWLGERLYNRFYNIIRN